MNLRKFLLFFHKRIPASTIISILEEDLESLKEKGIIIDFLILSSEKSNFINLVNSFKEKFNYFLLIDKEGNINCYSDISNIKYSSIGELKAFIIIKSKFNFLGFLEIWCMLRKRLLIFKNLVVYISLLSILGYFLYLFLLFKGEIFGFSISPEVIPLLLIFSLLYFLFYVIFIATLFLIFFIIILFYLLKLIKILILNYVPIWLIGIIFVVLLLIGIIYVLKLELHKLSFGFKWILSKINLLNLILIIFTFILLPEGILLKINTFSVFSIIPLAVLLIMFLNSTIPSEGIIHLSKLFYKSQLKSLIILWLFILLIVLISAPAIVSSPINSLLFTVYLNKQEKKIYMCENSNKKYIKCIQFNSSQLCNIYKNPINKNFLTSGTIFDFLINIPWSKGYWKEGQLFSFVIKSNSEFSTSSFIIANNYKGEIIYHLLCNNNSK
jgi:hypothetical protein